MFGIHPLNSKNNCSFLEILSLVLQDSEYSIYIPQNTFLSFMSWNRYTLSRFQKDLFTGTDIVRMIVVVSLSAVAFMLTAVAPDYNALHIYPLIYCIPILLVALWFPQKGIWVTGLLVAGFALIQAYLSVLGVTIDFVMTGLHMTILFWVFGATTLFSRSSHLTASRCRQILGDTHDAKFLCDPQTLRLLCVSRRCADILGYAPQDLVGLPAEMFWADEGGKAWFIEEMNREGYIGNTEVTLRAQNGDLRAVLLSCRALVPENLFECTVVDIGSLKAEHNSLIRSNERLTELIQQSNDIFFMHDAAGRILHFSWLRASEHGITPDDLVGRGVDALLPIDLARRHMEWVRKVILEQKNARYDLDLAIAGVRHTFSVTLAPYAGADGSLIGIVGSARDSTEIRRQRIACRQMTWEVDRWKGLVTTLSHELRTPLQPLIGYLEMLIENPGRYGLARETEKFLATCLACAGQEQAVVERMVALSLLTMDPIELAVQDVPLRRLIGSVISDGAYDEEAQFYNEIPESTHIWGDRDRLYLAVESLVSNAVKYNEPPKKVWIRYAESNDNHYIMVCDNGIGIPKNSIDAIFGSFYIGETEKQNPEGDRIGMGLPIAERYVRLHGGEITVTSAVGEGSTFTIRLPKEA